MKIKFWVTIKHYLIDKCLNLRFKIRLRGWRYFHFFNQSSSFNLFQLKTISREFSLHSCLPGDWPDQCSWDRWLLYSWSSLLARLCNFCRHVRRSLLSHCSDHLHVLEHKPRPQRKKVQQRIGCWKWFFYNMIFYTITFYNIQLDLNICDR